MGLSIYFYKTSQKPNGDVINAYDKDEKAFKDTFNKKRINRTKKLQNLEYDSFEYRLQYYRLLKDIKKFCDSMTISKFSQKMLTAQQITDLYLSKRIFTYRRPTAYFHKVYGILDYFLDAKKIDESVTQCWVEKDDINALIAKYEKRYANVLTPDEDKETIKGVIKELKKIIRYWNDKTNVYVVFDM